MNRPPLPHTAHAALGSVAIPVALFWIIGGLLIAAGINANAGRLVYPLDDTYIHMAMARHAVESGVWGVTAHAFTSSTSSPLWTFLLSVWFRLAGVDDVAPLILNFVAGTLLIFAADRILRPALLPPRRMLVLSILVITVPLPTLAVVGMEHLLHALLILLFVFGVSGQLASGAAPDRRRDVAMLTLAALAVATRYESLFAVALAAVLLVLRGRPRYALALVLSSLVLVGPYAVWSLANGWPPVPASVLVKGFRPAFSALGIVSALLGFRVIFYLSNYTPLLVLVVSLLGLLAATADRIRRWQRAHFAALLAGGTAILQLQFAGVGWLYRYEAYLFVLAIVALASAVAGSEIKVPTVRDRAVLFVRAGALALIVLFMSAPLAMRAGAALRDTLIGTHEIYLQQWQMSSFVRRFYNHRTIVINDIGAISYRGNARIIDLWGLATLDTALWRLADTYDNRRAADLADRAQAEIAIVYDSVLTDPGVGDIPPHWIPVGQWRIPTGVVVASPVVSFYALKPESRDELSANLRAFMADLPPEVVQSGSYIQYVPR